MRIQRQEDYGPLSAEIARLRETQKVLVAEHETRQARLQEEAGRVPGDYSEHAVAVARREVAEVQAEQRALAERIVALESRLPTGAARAEAETQATSLAHSVEEQRTRFSEAWSRLAGALDAAEQIALDLDAIRSAAAKDIAQVEDLKARSGLDVAVPAPLRQDDARLRATQAMLISEAAHGTPRETVRREVESVRSTSAA